MRRTLVQVTSGYFCAGIVFDGRYKVEDAAPILRWTVGKSVTFLQPYFARKGWHAVVVGPLQ